MCSTSSTVNAEVISSLGSTRNSRTSDFAMRLHHRDDRAQGPGDEQQHRHEDERRALGSGEREVLRDHLADDDVQVDDDEQGERERQPVGHSLGQTEVVDDRFEGVVQGGLGDGTRAAPSRP